MVHITERGNLYLGDFKDTPGLTYEDLVHMKATKTIIWMIIKEQATPHLIGDIETQGRTPKFGLILKDVKFFINFDAPSKRLLTQAEFEEEQRGLEEEYTSIKV